MLDFCTTSSNFQELQSQIDEVNAANEAAKAAAESEAAGIAAARKEAAMSIQKIRSDAEAKILAASNVVEQTKEEHAATLAEIEENTKRSLQDAHRRAQNASERSKAEAQRLEAEKIQEIEQIKNLAGSTITAANKKAQKEKEELEKRFAEALDTHEEKMSAEFLGSARAIAELKAEMETKLQNAQEEAQAEVAKLEAELEEQRTSTYINITNIERDVIAVCNEVVSVTSDFLCDLALSSRDWAVSQSKHAHSNVVDVYSNGIRPAVVSAGNGLVDGAKAMYTSHIQPPMNQIRDNAQAKYSEVVQPHIYEHLTPIYEEKIKPAFNQHVLPAYINHVVPAYNNHVVPAMNRALDATVASWDVTVRRADDMKQSAWKDIKEALKLAEEASLEAYGYAAAFIRTIRLRSFEFSVDGAERFFDGCLGFIEKYDGKGVVPDTAKEKLAAARNNADTFVEIAAWATLACLFVAFLPFFMNVVVLILQVAIIVAFELATWPFRAVWFFCFGRKEEVVPDAIEVSPAASIEVGESVPKKQSTHSGSDEPQSPTPDLVNESVNMHVRPITPPDKSMSGPQTRSWAVKKNAS